MRRLILAWLTLVGFATPRQLGERFGLRPFAVRTVLRGAGLRTELRCGMQAVRVREFRRALGSNKGPESLDLRSERKKVGRGCDPSPDPWSFTPTRQE